MENLSRKIHSSQFVKIHRELNEKLDWELYIQLDRQSYWGYRNLRNLIRNQLESQLFWILDERLGEQLKTQMEHGKSQ
jgi:hypothetical protein